MLTGNAADPPQILIDTGIDTFHSEFLLFRATAPADAVFCDGCTANDDQSG